MAISIVEKYEQIFAADPRSRIFVELARALLERGDPGRAIEVCRTGLEHHSSSILGRVIWGRSLLALGDLRGAQDQFAIAVALDPASPYAFNLVGEALYGKELFREALPILARAVELQPADARLRGWLEEARRRVQAQGGELPAPRSAPAAPPRAEGDDEEEDVAAASLSLVDDDAPADAGAARTPPLGSAGTPAPVIRAAAPARKNGAVPLPAPATPAGASAAVPLPAPAAPARANGAVPLPAPAAAPPPAPPPLTARPAAPPPVPPAHHRDEIPRSLLAMIPATRPAASAPAPAPAAAPPVDDAQVEEITAKYAQEVRDRLLTTPEQPSFLRRYGSWLAGLVVVGGLAAAAAVFFHAQKVNRAEEVGRAAAAARAGLARDTVGALREASRVLADARKHGSSPELASLAAQIEALLAVEYADGDARPLAAELAKDPDAGDGATAATYLLARSPSELAAAEADVLAAPTSSEPLLQELAGRILLKRGQKDGARGRFERAAHAAPPLLRALADLGDLSMAAGDPEGALGFYGAALGAHPTHPRSVIGAAEARLALRQDLQRSRAELDALAADPGSAPPPALRVRYELAAARVVFATGDGPAAVARLSKAGTVLGENAALLAAAAEIHLAMRAYDRAEAAAAQAVRLAAGDADARVLLAKARIARGRYDQALKATGTAEGRALWIQRGIARYHLGQYAAAQKDLERTAPSGHMPAEAVIWYALARMQQGHAEEARGLLESATATRAPPPLTWIALGQVLDRLGRGDEAEAAYRTAAQRDPGAPEGHAALGLRLHARGAEDEAIVELQKAVTADPSDLGARSALAAARLATGQPSLARAELDAVLLARPADLDALRQLSAAWLAEGNPAEARRAADRGLARAPNDPALLLAAARAALAQGDAATARSLADRAVKAARRGPAADQAKAFRAQLPRR